MKSSPKVMHGPRRSGLQAVILSLVLVGSGAWGCAPKHPASPDAAVDRYAKALRDEDWDAAYSLLSDESRSELSRDEFRRLMVQNDREVDALLRRIRARSSPPYVTARIVTASGDQLTLIYEDGGWKIDESAVDLYGQRTPRQALGSFVRAYDQKRFDVLLKFVPRRDLSGLSEQVLKQAWEGEQKVEIEQIVEGLRVSYRTAKLEVLGEHATMSYGSGATVELVLEDGTWKIENFQ